MRSTLLPILLLLASTKATPPWMKKLLPKVCIPRVTDEDETPLIPPNVLHHLREDINLIAQDLRENEHRIDKYSTDVDKLIAQVFSLRARVNSPSKHDLNQETVLIQKIADRAEECLTQKIADRAEECLTSSRPQTATEEHTSGKQSTEKKSSTEENTIKKYNKCVSNYFGPNHEDQLKNELLQSISSQKLKTEEIRAKILSAARADVANVHAHRLKCFAAIEERIKVAKPTKKDKRKKIEVEPSTERKELDEEFKAIDKDLEEAGKELDDWRKQQAEIVKHLFNDLLSKKSQTEVLQSQEDRLNALVTLARKEKVNGKAKEQFPFNTNKELHPKVQGMMKNYLSCVRPRLQWCTELRRELHQELTTEDEEEFDHTQLAAKREKFIYFWGRHIIRIHLDFANAMADSLNCYVETERKLFYVNK